MLLTRINMQWLLVMLICAVSVSAITINHRRRFPGVYCGSRSPQQCCPGRDDTCTVPIRDTVCYCDIFCGIHNVEDCCPDFEDVCKGTRDPEPQPQNQCIHNNRLYSEGESVKRDCNTCRCVLFGAPSILSWECENLACINEQSLVDSINNGRYGWTARPYDKFDGVSVEQGLRYYLGTIRPKAAVVALNPLVIKSDEEFDREFDSRVKWPAYIHRAMDQGECASSWAFSTASVAADRWSIQSQGKFAEQMSMQSMISCSAFVEGCDGGRIEDAWYFLQKEGVVSNDCYPYTSGTTRTKGQCKYLEDLNCGEDHVHKTTPPYRIAKDERQIMKEIQLNGPVQAIINVRPDFYLYQEGVYSHTGEELRHTEHDHSLSGIHSVKIIGWGEDENRVKFWHCVNSWGQRWGEDGMFKIKRGVDESGIEDFIIGVWARVEKHTLQD